MKIKHFIQIALVLAAIISGCKTTQVIPPVKPVEPVADTVAIPVGELRLFTVMAETWMNDHPDTVASRINSVIDNAAAANFNVVLFFIRGDGGQLVTATEAAHRNGLKIWAGVDMTQLTRNIIPLPEKKAMQKERISGLVEKHDIDGLAITTADLPADILEDVLAEAMLIKPYLVNTLIYSGESGFQAASACLEAGIADYVFPDTGMIKNLTVSFPEKIRLPLEMKKMKPEQVAGLDLSALFAGDPGGQTVKVNGRTKITDTRGEVCFVFNGDTIVTEAEGKIIALPVAGWFTPFRYSVTEEGAAVRKAPWVEFRRMPADVTDTPEFDLLCKSDYPALVFINGDSVKQYKTGIFFNKILLKEGQNRVRATVMTDDSVTVFYEREFTYAKSDRTRKPFPLWIDSRSVEPASDIELLPEDVVRVSFRGSAGQDGFVEVRSAKITVKCSREDFADYSIYRADLPLKTLSPGTAHQIIMKLMPAADAPDSKSYEFVARNTLMVRELSDFPLVRVTRDNSRLTYNLGAPRLGGPIRAELGPGVVMKTNGRIGDNYRIRLSRVEEGFISINDAEKMPAGAVQPSYFITGMSCTPGKDADILSIPYPEPVPYEVYPDPDHRRIVITLFGVGTSSTWISHYTGRKIIDRITWEQVSPETYKVYVNLKDSEMWGYDLKQDGKRLLLKVKYPPEYDLTGVKPLAGLKIAIEAGHGGTGMGAIGLSGLVEKEINLDLSFRLGELCKSMGAEVVQARDSDRDMALIEKRDIAVNSGADMLISIHANAGGRGYLSVGGTSTYWHNPFWEPLAQTIYDRLLELKLVEFGVVGSFNYTVTRTSQLPSILVEQAFMTHAEDEEKLADPEFRQQMAQKIYEGIIDYLKMMKQK